MLGRDRKDAHFSRLAEIALLSRFEGKHMVSARSKDFMGNRLHITYSPLAIHDYQGNILLRKGCPELCGLLRERARIADIVELVPTIRAQYQYWRTIIERVFGRIRKHRQHHIIPKQHFDHDLP